MTRLYRKNELTFALVWVGLYVVLFSLADSVSLSLGVQKSVTVPLCLLMAGVLMGWLLKSGLAEAYGLRGPRGGGRRFLYWVPLAVIVSVNLWGGVTMNFPPLESALYVVSMMVVGLLEELIFRGLLYKALRRNGAKSAVLISSLTFGLGHIVNLLNGAPVVATLLQIVYATAIGFLFVVLFEHSGSLIPCIVTHSAINALSTFAVQRGEGFGMAVSAALTIIALAYALWVIKQPAAEREEQA